MKACVNKKSCIGCGMCTSICPGVFVMDDDGLARALDGEVETGLQTDAQEAQMQCPVGAIEIE